MVEYVLPCSIYLAVALVSELFFYENEIQVTLCSVDVIWMLDFNSHLYTKQQPWLVGKSFIELQYL